MGFSCEGWVSDTPVTPKGAVRFSLGSAATTPVVINDFVKQTSFSGSTENPPCVPGSLYQITAVWQNISKNYLSNVAAQVTTLTNNAQLIEQRFTLAASKSVAPQESFTGVFRVKLATCAAFTFRINLLGDVSAQAPSAPALLALAPSTGRQGQSNLIVNLVGAATSFAQSSSQVNFGPGILVNSIVVASPTGLTADVSIAVTAAIGPRTVTVTTGNQVVSLTNGFAVTTGAPVLLAVSPATIQQGQTFSVALTGRFTNWFQGTTKATLGAGISVTSLTVNSPTSATAVLSADAAATPGPRTVTLTTSNEVASLVNGFTVSATTTVPSITSLSPNSGLQGQQNLSVAITGQNTHFLQGSTQVSFGAGITVNSLTVNSPTTATAILNIDSAAATGRRTVTLTTGSESVALATGFTVIGPVCAVPFGLVSWWPGDGNANDVVSGNNGALQNGASFGAGEVGQAFSFVH